MIEVVNFWNKAYINLTAPLVRVFKLDKVDTRIDSLYVESNNRIYLNPYDMRAFHLDNYWQQMLGLFGTEEQEETMSFIVNFEDMVQRIRDLKHDHITDVYITYDGTGIPSALKTGNNFLVKINGSTVINYNLLEVNYNTTKKLATAINTIDDWTVTLDGRNDTSPNLVDFNEVVFTGQTLNVFSEEIMYDNVTDVIEAGDAILTNKWRLYEVKNAQPAGDFAWDYVTWKLDCTLARMDQMDLPANYAAEIEEHQYGIKDKIGME
jgi:hypothetical protein